MSKTTNSSELLASALKVENRRLQKRIAGLEAKLISVKSRVTALEKEIKLGNNRELLKILDDISRNETGADAKSA